MMSNYGSTNLSRKLSHTDGPHNSLSGFSNPGYHNGVQSETGASWTFLFKDKEAPPVVVNGGGGGPGGTEQRTFQEWSHGLFECYKFPFNCLLTAILPCFIEYWTAKRAGAEKVGLWLFGLTFVLVVFSLLSVVLLSSSRTDQRQLQLEEDVGLELLDPVATQDTITDLEETRILLVCAIATIVAVIAAKLFLAVILRKRVRRAFNIRQSTLFPNTDQEDIAYVICCYSCALCQEKNTVDDICHMMIHDDTKHLSTDF